MSNLVGMIRSYHIWLSVWFFQNLSLFKSYSIKDDHFVQKQGTHKYFEEMGDMVNKGVDAATQTDEMWHEIGDQINELEDRLKSDEMELDFACEVNVERDFRIQGLGGGVKQLREKPIGDGEEHTNRLKRISDLSERCEARRIRRAGGRAGFHENMENAGFSEEQIAGWSKIQEDEIDDFKDQFKSRKS